MEPQPGRCRPSRNPERDLDRRQKKASSIGAYREMYGHDHPADPIGPEPTRDSPDQRAAWHDAFRAFAPADGGGPRWANFLIRKLSDEATYREVMATPRDA